MTRNVRNTQNDIAQAYNCKWLSQIRKLHRAGKGDRSVSPESSLDKFPSCFRRNNSHNNNSSNWIEVSFEILQNCVGRKW